MAAVSDPGSDALHKLKSTDPPVFLAPSSISEVARVVSQYLFSKLKPQSPNSPFDQLLVDGFDAEQIWQQIDMQSQPLLSSLRKEVKRFEKNPQELRKLGNSAEAKSLKVSHADDMDMDGFETDDDDGDEDEELEGKNDEGAGGSLEGGSESEGEEEEEVEDGEDEEEEDDGEGEEDDGEEEEDDGENKGIEDGFFSIKQLQEFLEEGEAEELGLDNKSKKRMAKGKRHNVDDDEDEDGEDEGDDEEDEFGAFGDDDDEDEKAEKNARYEDFFGDKKKGTKRKSEDSSEEQDAEGAGNQGNENLSTHERELLKLQSKIKQMEKANLDPKHWTMQGEVTAAKRPKNSALEVDLDFEHNARPAPVITEEVTASLEEMLRNRIIEGRFDDVRKPLSLPTKAPREVKELDDSKSKNGLAEVYEEEYVQKTNPAFAPTSHSDELKKEASILFKKLCLKLDALSHFHFTPKPVIEDMSVQANVPAIAMEEVAPVAVSDAALLAPEEIFSVKGAIKEDSELTKEERKRRRAKKKRKFKAESAKRTAKKAQDSTTQNSKTGFNVSCSEE